MARAPGTTVFRIGGIPVAAVGPADLLQTIEAHLAGGAEAPGAFVTFCGAHGIVEAQEDRRLAHAYEDALLTVADGRPLVWVGRVRGIGGVDQVPGIESVEQVCRAGLAHGWRHYFYGGRPGVAAALASRMAARVPGLAIAGTETPPFRPLAADEVEAMHARIAGAGTNILWVGLGAPKQELFMAEHADRLPGIVQLGVGAAFDVLTGFRPRAPRLLQRLGLEWAFRLLLEPRRLWPRYSVAVPGFLRLALRREGGSEIEDAPGMQPAETEIAPREQVAAQPAGPVDVGVATQKRP